MQKIVIKIEKRGETHLYQLLQRYALNFTAGGGAVPNRFTIHTPDDFTRTKIVEGLRRYKYTLRE